MRRNPSLPLFCLRWCPEVVPASQHSVPSNPDEQHLKGKPPTLHGYCSLTFHLITPHVLVSMKATLAEILDIVFVSRVPMTHLIIGHHCRHF